MFAYQLAVLIALLAFLCLVRRNLRDYRTPAARLPQACPSVSLCVPARNESRNIEACLAGLLSQEYPNFQVLVLER